MLLFDLDLYDGINPSGAFAGLLILLDWRWASFWFGSSVPILFSMCSRSVHVIIVPNSHFVQDEREAYFSPTDRFLQEICYFSRYADCLRQGSKLYSCLINWQTCCCYLHQQRSGLDSWVGACLWICTRLKIYDVSLESYGTPKHTQRHGWHLLPWFSHY